MMFAKKMILSGVVVVLCLELCQGRVLELDDRFREARKSGEWLVMFYAPWCGHCRQLEPIWMEIGNAMEGHVVNVARLDSTIYSSLSGEYGVRGFPTIKYISGSNNYEYGGARTKQAIMSFVEKARGPKFGNLDNTASVKDAQKKHDVFFIYVGDSDTHLRKSFEKVAEKLFLTIKFYVAPSSTFSSVEAPTVLAFKNGAHHIMPLSAETVHSSQLSHWINSEQISDYSELTRISYQSLKRTNKLFAVAVMDAGKHSKTLRANVKDIALARNELFHSKFVFCWVKNNAVINKMTYATISAPNFVVFNPQNYEYYVLNGGIDAAFDEKEINSFLTDVTNGKISALGGSGFIQQVKRFFFDSTGTVINFFKDSPIMASLVIGVPTFVISFLCYCLCTMEDGGEEEVGTDSESDEAEEDAEELPEYQEEETAVRRRNVDEEPAASEQSIGDAPAETAIGDAPAETDKDK